MKAVEFTADLTGTSTLSIPSDVLPQLPKNGRVRVIVLSDHQPAEDAEWRAAAYEQFLADDSSEDAVYDSLR